jgi:hypothetical protein
MNTDTMSVLWELLSQLKRAIVTQWGLGANLPEDAIYPSNLADETGKPLDGAHKYTIHFDNATVRARVGTRATASQLRWRAVSHLVYRLSS